MGFVRPFCGHIFIKGIAYVHHNWYQINLWSTIDRCSLEGIGRRCHWNAALDRPEIFAHLFGDVSLDGDAAAAHLGALGFVTVPDT
jgi:hypothetical protein